MSTRKVAEKRKRSFRPAIDDLEGRQLMSTAQAVVYEPPAPAIVHVEHTTPIARQGQPAMAQDRVEDAHLPVVRKVDHTQSQPLRSSATPVGLPASSTSAVEFEGKFYKAWVDKTNQDSQGKNFGYIHISVSPNLVNWPQNFSIPEKADETPALAVYNGRLYVAWLRATEAGSLTHHIEVESSSDGVQFGDAEILPEKSDYAPALASASGQLYLAWVGLDKHLNVESSTDREGFGNKVTLSETSSASPALAEFDGRIYLAWTGTDKAHHLNIASSPDGVNWDSKVTLAETVSGGGGGIAYAGPSLAAFDGRLYVAWNGNDPGNHINVASSSDGVTFGNRVTYAESCRDASGPSLVTFKGKLYVSWTAGNRKHQVMPVADGSGPIMRPAAVI
jgi:hypothetical protein